MIRLYTSYFDSGDKSRQKELDKCLKENIVNGLIDQIVLLAEAQPPRKAKHMKVIEHPRPTYDDFFNISRSMSTPADISIIANSDIYFDGTLEWIRRNIPAETVFCLSRSDKKGKWLIPHHSKDSQDVWIWKGKLREVNGGFYLGKPGCDNRIAAEFSRAGYKVSNPCGNIRCIHLHESQVKSYERNFDHLVPPPHLMVRPIKIR